MKINILGIESSCDDTAAAISQDGNILCNVIANQQVHQEYGGVVPELASRAHQQQIVPVVEMALKKAGMDKKELSAIAFTLGPGLLGSLLVGSSFAKAMAFGLDIPIITVNHMKGHVLSHFIEDPKPEFPFICLTVSGGHTQIVLVRDHLDMEVIGTTIDDAAGEAFDKAAKMMGLQYPGGPLVDKLAKEGDPLKFKFAQPKVPNWDYSFSGLKTSILYYLQKQMKENPEFINENLKDLCASVQYTIIEILTKPLEKIMKAQGITSLAIAGGVSANSGLRQRVQELGDKNNWKVFIPKFEYCTDNAAMIATTAYYQYLQNDFASLDAVPKARFPING